jgi:hypothetical protein
MKFLQITEKQGFFGDSTRGRVLFYPSGEKKRPLSPRNGVTSQASWGMMKAVKILMIIPQR